MIYFLQQNNWQTLNSAIDAYATLLATLIALFASIWSVRQVKRQIEVQNDFQRRKLEEGFLRDALHIVHEFYYSAQAFVASANRFEEYAVSSNFSTVDRAPYQREFQRELRDSWKHFDRTLNATIRILEESDKENDNLKDVLEKLFNASAQLHDLLLDNSESIYNYKEDLDLKNVPVALKVKNYADIAAKLISKKIGTLYRSR